MIACRTLTALATVAAVVTTVPRAVQLLIGWPGLH